VDVARRADFKSHHIEGFAHAAATAGVNGQFSVPLVTHVVGNLWQGGCIDGVELPHDFDYVLSLYPWERYELGPDTHRVEVKLYDAAELPDEEQLLELARQVNEWCSRGKTLVHCQAGLNRSGLVTGLALVLQGYAPEDAVALMRRQRCDVVLCNAPFRGWLLQQQEAV
jgi:hypothetical protein